MPQPNDLSRSLVALDQNSTIIAVIEMSQSSWLVAGVLPGIERQPRKKLEPNAEGLLGLLHRWRDEAIRAGKEITRIAVAFEAGRDGFWLARWRGARGRGARDPFLECGRFAGTSPGENRPARH
jgi:transposase